MIEDGIAKDTLSIVIVAFNARLLRIASSMSRTDYIFL